MAKSIKFGDDIYLDPSGIKHQIISTRKTVQAVANQFVYTGLSVAIPANCEYELTLSVYTTITTLLGYVWPETTRVLRCHISDMTMLRTEPLHL